MADNLPNPESREEAFLAKAAGEDVELPKPASRKEEYLNAIAQGGGGGGYFDFSDLYAKVMEALEEEEGNQAEILITKEEFEGVLNNLRQGKQPKVIEDWSGEGVEEITTILFPKVSFYTSVEEETRRWFFYTSADDASYIFEGADAYGGGSFTLQVSRSYFDFVED